MHSTEHSEWKKKSSRTKEGQIWQMPQQTSETHISAPPNSPAAQSWTSSCKIWGHIEPDARAMHFPTALFCKAFLLLESHREKGWSPVYLIPTTAPHGLRRKKPQLEIQFAILPVWLLPESVWDQESGLCCHSTPRESPTVPLLPPQPPRESPGTGMATAGILAAPPLVQLN